MPGTGVLVAARAEALFMSELPTGTEPSREQVADAIRSAVAAHRGTRGCASGMAAAYGDYPEIAVPRMRWALGIVLALYPGRGL